MASALLRLGFPSAPHLKCLTLPVSATRRTVLQKVRGHTLMQASIVLPQFVGTGFQVLFHSPPGVLFTFPSQYSALSVTEEYSALRGGPRFFPQGFPCLVVLWIPPLLLPLRLRGFHPLQPVFPVPFCCGCKSLPRSEPRNARAPVWAPSCSLAATWEIDFSFFSSGYLDVSVHRVPLHRLFGLSPLFSCGYMEAFHVGFPIQISAALWIFAPPRGFSQLITSFFGSQCQGILPAPFSA